MINRVSVIGLGKLGACMAATLASKGMNTCLSGSVIEASRRDHA